ncbi:hypothetical protein BGZ91_009347, partial [Linnemannia elongata]
SKFIRVQQFYIGEAYQHLNILVKSIAPACKTAEQQQLFKLHLIRIYEKLESWATMSDEFLLSTKQMPSYMKTPYILNGNDKDPSEATSWVWPANLMFDIDQNISSYQVVDKFLHRYRTLLVALGAEQMQHVEGSIDVTDGRKRGDMEDQIQNCFETQDQHTGFMDIRFKFQVGSDIVAHKVVLARASEYFFRRFTGVWASNLTRDPEDPGVHVIDLSSYGDIKKGFWGLLIEEQRVREKVVRRMRKGCQNEFEATRLKELIAQELVIGQKVIHSNVFNIRSHAERNQAVNVKEHCDKFITKNKSSVLKYVEGEILAQREELRRLEMLEAQDDDENDEDYVPSNAISPARALVEEELRVLQENLAELLALS